MDTTKTITHIGLCAGYGGIELGLARVLPTLRSVALCEIEAFPIANLVAKMEAGLMDAAPVWTDLKSFPWESFRDRVDILTGGYPCQPFSSAGKRAGKDDPRHLWPWIADGIRILRPRMCFFENVEGHISLGLREVIGELEEIGYKTAWGIFSAREVGAPHQRKRVFILANRIGDGYDWRELQDRVEGWASSQLPQPHEGESCGVRSEVSGCGQAWPSRPGEPQHAWEPSRVVGNAIHDAGFDVCGTQCGQAKQSISSDSGSMGNAESEQGSPRNHRPESGTTSEPQQVESGGGGCGSLREGNGKTKPPLGLHSNESSSFLGQALTLNPYGDNVLAYENISKKARTREVLFSVWREAVSQEIQWTTGGLQCFLAEKILQSGMQLDSFTQRICYFIWCIQTGHEAQGWGLRGMWVYETCGDSSQGQKPIEQFQRELGYAMCQLSYEIALEGRKDAVETEGILQGVRKSSERAWALSEALPEMEEVWRSSLDQTVWEKGCYVEAASIGNRTDELRLLGNGVVPATAERAFRTLLKELECLQ